MPLIDYSEPQPTPIPEEPVKVTPDIVDQVAVDASVIPVNSLITHVEGSVWITEAYYSQVLTPTTELSSQQVNQAAVYQQYVCIKGMELRVTTPLEQTQTNDTRSFEVRGSATVYPFLTPNRGDMFIANVGDGRQGVFTLTNTERRTIFKEACFVIDYQLVAYLDEVRRKDFEEKTVKVTHFVKERMTQAQRPVLVESELKRYQDLKRLRRELVERYLREFFSREFRVLLVPDQDEATYDPYLNEFVTKVIGGDEHPFLREIRHYNLAGDEAEEAFTLWDLLLKGELPALHYTEQKMWTISTRPFQRWPSMQSVYYTQLMRVVYPCDQRHLVDKPYRRTLNWVGDSLRNTVAQLNFEEKCRALRGKYKLAETTQPIFAPLVEDDYYVFGQGFYNQDTASMSILEAHVLQYLDGKVGDVAELLWLCECSALWTAVERYYLVPVLLTLVIVSLEKGI